MANSLKERKYFFIYKTTNLLNGKYYIGMHTTSNLKDGYLGSGKHLKYAIRKHGKENFKCEVLEFLNNREELIGKEKELVTLELIKDPLCMNLKEGGAGGLGGLSEETRKRIQDGASKHQKKVWQNEEYRIKIKKSLAAACLEGHKKGTIKYDNFKDRTHTEETKTKMIVSHKDKHTGNKNSQYGTCWITNEVENKKIKKIDLIPVNWRLGRKIK